MQPKVNVRGLRKRYGRVEAVRGVDFVIAEGEIFGLLGPNGAGKTTTVECIIGLREPDEGEVEVCGIDARRERGEVQQRIGAALQTTSLPDKITPRESLELFGSFYRNRMDPGTLLERFSLAEQADARFDTLSGGQRQRLALALAFVNEPELVFLDEPTVGLDAHSRRDLHGEIARMKRDGYTVLLTTHYIEEAELLCDRIGIIDRGRIIALGTPAELVARSGAQPIVSLRTAAPVPAERLARLAPQATPSVEGEWTRFPSDDLGGALAGLAALVGGGDIELLELHVRKASLEDVFLELTGAEPGGGPPGDS
jgi:ABC-2 type transport system ATP-binding protein